VSGSAASLAEQNRESGQARLTPFLAPTYKRGPDVSFVA